MLCQFLNACLIEKSRRWMKIVSIDTESDIRVPSAFATGHRNDGGDNAKDTSQDWMEMKSKAIQP